MAAVGAGVTHIIDMQVEFDDTRWRRRTASMSFGIRPMMTLSPNLQSV